MAAGYSGTPLAKKLGVKSGQQTWRFRMPESVAADIERSGDVPVVQAKLKPGVEMAHLFVTKRDEFAMQLGLVRKVMQSNATIWVSWPKKASKMPTDVTEDTIRAAAFPLGLVDVKVCAVDEVWSGLKLVLRVSER